MPYHLHILQGTRTFTLCTCWRGWKTEVNHSNFAMHGDQFEIVHTQILSSVPNAICWLMPTGGNVQRNTGPKISSSSSCQSSSRSRSEEAQTLKAAARNVAIGLCTFCSCVFTHIKGSRTVCKRKLNSWLRIDLVNQSLWWFQSMKLKYEKHIVRSVSAEM